MSSIEPNNLKKERFEPIIKFNILKISVVFVVFGNSKKFLNPFIKNAFGAPGVINSISYCESSVSYIQS